MVYLRKKPKLCFREDENKLRIQMHNYLLVKRSVEDKAPQTESYILVMICLKYQNLQILTEKYLWFQERQ